MITTEPTTTTTSLRERADKAYERKLETERNQDRMRHGRLRRQAEKLLLKNLHISPVPTPTDVPIPEDIDTVDAAWVYNIDDDIRIAFLATKLGRGALFLVDPCEDCGTEDAIRYYPIQSLSALGEALDGAGTARCFACDAKAKARETDVKKELSESLGSRALEVLRAMS